MVYKSHRMVFTHMPTHITMHDFYTSSNRQHGVTIRELLVYAEQNGLSLDTPILCQHVEDCYVTQHRSTQLRVPGDDDNYFGQCDECSWNVLDRPCEYTCDCGVFERETASSCYLGGTPDCCAECPERETYIYADSVTHYENKILLNLHC